MISKLLQILGFFSINIIFFSHIRSEQFWKQNTIFFIRPHTVGVIKLSNQLWIDFLVDRVIFRPQMYMHAPGWVPNSNQRFLFYENKPSQFKTRLNFVDNLPTIISHLRDTSDLFSKVTKCY